MIELRQITGGISLGILDLEAFSKARLIAVKRQQEKAGTLFVLEALLGPHSFELAYTPHNKPFLKNDARHISISHSHSRLVVILNNHAATGIDVELMRDKILTVRHKFLNPHEAAFAQDDLEKLIGIWAAKEAMYKYYGLKGLDFKQHLSVADFDGDVILGKIELADYRKKFKLVKETAGSYVMVYILQEID